MAQLVLGVGTSHSPLLAIDPALWSERARDDSKMERLVLGDGRVLTYAQLDAEVGGRYRDLATDKNFKEQARLAQVELDFLAAAIQSAQVDALVVIGDDQGELFSKAHTPAIAVFNGPEVVTLPKSEITPGLPGWHQQANRGYRMDSVHRSPAAPAIANAVIDGLIDGSVDVAVASEVLDPYVAGFGHAYGFVLERLCGDAPIPLVPIMLNTYFPPNVPRPGRCYDIGVLMGNAIRAVPEDLRVGVVASGGRSHFAGDDELDRSLLTAFAEGDEQHLRKLNPEALRSGNSEILNWVMTAGAVQNYELTHSEYIPVYRTAAGTGVGLAFATWHPRSN
jgi:hypothetical protein